MRTVSWWRRAAAAAVLLAVAATVPLPAPVVPAADAAAVQFDPWSERPPDFEWQRRERLAADRAWREASAGHMRMEKIFYRSRVGDLDIPAFVFQPVAIDEGRRYPALVWVHENVRGRVYEHYIPYVREATARGYVVIAPEYRGSVGYGREFYDAIDYGGAEVDDVVTTAAVLGERYPHVDPERIGVIGWSHGGMIAMLAVTRHPGVFTSAAAIVPVVNLIHRISAKGEGHIRVIDPHNRIGGSPRERPDVWRERSPLFQVDRLQVPLLLHVAGNDRDVPFEESRPLVAALRTRAPGLADIKVYDSPAGGHLFDRQVDPWTWRPVGGPDQRDSWERVWAFFARTLGAAQAAGR